MALWLNHVAIAAPRNGTTTHTVDPSGGSVVVGTSFTPTAGRLLVCVVEGSVTSTTPSGWTLPSGGSAINNTGLYVFTKTAAGADTVTSTHNGSNYAVVFHFFEFAAGSTFVGSQSATGVNGTSGTGPSLTGLTGTNLLFGVYAAGVASGSGAAVSWSAGVELIDTQVASAATDGYSYSLTYLEDSVLTSWNGGTHTTTHPTAAERLTFGVKVSASAPAAIPTLVMATHR